MNRQLSLRNFLVHQAEQISLRFLFGGEHGLEVGLRGFELGLLGFLRRAIFGEQILDLRGRGVVINGLPILTVEPDLDDYYREHVMGGEGSFVIAIKRFEDFSEAIVKKLIAEIAMNEGVKRRRL